MTLKVLAFLPALFASPFLEAKPLLEVAGKHWFNGEWAPPVGIESEIHGISQSKASSLLLGYLGGHVQATTKTDVFYSQRGKPRPYTSTVYHHFDTLVGNFKVIIDDNGSSVNSFKKKNIVTEIVFEPTNAEQVEILDGALKHLMKHGAKGATDNVAVALQFNIQFGNGVHPDSVSIKEVLDFLRNYLHPLHRLQIAEYFRVSPNRQRYMGYFSSGMMDRIMDESYRPTKMEFYNDFMYRQVLEHFGYSQAWGMDVEDAKEVVRLELSGDEKSFERILPLMKWNYVRISSLMLFLYPNEWMSKFLMDSEWAFKPYPVIEVREPNSSSKVFRVYNAVVGLVQRSQEKGAFLHQDGINFKKKDVLITHFPRLKGASLPRCSVLFH